MSAKTYQEAEGQKLKEIFEREKRANKLTRPVFAKKMNFPGGPNLIYQHMEGLRPISLEAALLYAEGLGVGIEEFSPRIAEIAARISNHAKPRIAEPTAPYNTDLLDLYGEILLNVDKAIAAIEAGFGYKAKPGLRSKVLRILIERGESQAWTDSARLIGQIASLAKDDA
ncbi:hypothetical protein [Parvibium lacunae]|uniref:Uncharacterized protein n=1 Tax=Parvibium lacunae TaxID=1888893 RepID=A0A368L7Z7_9BURK|nr:hypothetical protein [Parvibium lacunae]RCS59734.1 hypothetical protein DU000_03225 [Parvibium lacunae]